MKINNTNVLPDTFLNCLNTNVLKLILINFKVMYFSLETILN